MGPTWGPPGPCRTQMSPMLAPWTLLSGYTCPPSCVIVHTITLLLGVLGEASFTYTTVRSCTKSLCMTVGWTTQTILPICRVCVGFTRWNVMFRYKNMQHYWDIIMDAIASQITNLAIVYSTFIQTQIKENIKAPRHWLCAGNSPGTGEFLAQMASNAENVSIWWRHHEEPRPMNLHQRSFP